MAEVAKNMYLAHKRFISEGWDNWSEFSYVHNVLGTSLATTDTLAYDPQASFWGNLYETTYFSQTVFKTIDKGLARIPAAFAPHLLPRTHFHRRIEALKTTSGRVHLFWRDSPTSKTLRNASYDYAVISAPFTQVRQWRLSGLSPAIGRAISHLGYSEACKVALQFRTRFWEHLDPPIFGGCTTTDIPGVGSFCYPSYRLNSSGPGVMLASYTSGDIAIRQVALTEEVHVQKTLEAMAEIHGDVVFKEYTGKYVSPSPHPDAADCLGITANAGSWTKTLARAGRIRMRDSMSFSFPSTLRRLMGRFLSGNIRRIRMRGLRPRWSRRLGGQCSYVWSWGWWMRRRILPRPGWVGGMYTCVA